MSVRQLQFFILLLLHFYSSSWRLKPIKPYGTYIKTYLSEKMSNSNCNYDIRSKESVLKQSNGFWKSKAIIAISSLVLSQTPLLAITTNFILSPLIHLTKNSVIEELSDVAHARPEGVNRPDLLPQDKSQVYPVIDTVNFLSKGQEKRITSSINNLEKNTGFKLRLLCQSYPNTPGLAIKDYWGIDDNTVVLVVDRGEGFNRKGIPTNIMNLNIGKNVDDVLPGMFWSRLTNKLGNQPYVKANGEDIAVINAVEAITYCLEDKNCKDLPFNL